MNRMPGSRYVKTGIAVGVMPVRT